MTLFNYSKCEQCKRRRYNKKMVLCNVLPTNVCDTIGEYVNDCWRCEKMKDNEKDFFTGFTGENNDINRPSNQLLFFRIYKSPFLTQHMDCFDEGLKKYKKEIDRILDRPSVKDKYVFNKMDLLALKSFCKKDSRAIKTVVFCCHSQKCLDEIFSPFFSSPENIFRFRNREYIVIDLVKRFLIEYVDDLIGSDKKYCDMDRIREHINNLFI